MKGLAFDLVLASRKDAEAPKQENNTTESWEGYQNLSG